MDETAVKAMDRPARWAPIRHEPGRRPLLADCESTCPSFAWAQARGQLRGLADGGTNIAHEAVDRFAVGPLTDVTALRFIDRAGVTSQLSYADLKQRTDRFASTLRTLGVGVGDRVCTLLGRVGAGPIRHRVLCGNLIRGSNGGITHACTQW